MYVYSTPKAMLQAFIDSPSLKTAILESQEKTIQINGDEYEIDIETQSVEFIQLSREWRESLAVEHGTRDLIQALLFQGLQPTAVGLCDRYPFLKEPEEDDDNKNKKCCVIS